MPEREATCSCGALTAQVSGEPRRVSVCHCLACQRRTGSAFGVQASFTPEQVTVNGPSSLYVRTADEDGEPRRYRFCPSCGATVLYDFGEGSDRVNIPLGAFTDPLDTGLPAPTRSIYESRQHAWLTITAPLGERWD